MTDALDVRRSAQLCYETLEPGVNLEWSRRARGLDWDCRFTVGHISDALGFYLAHLASRSEQWLKFDVVPHADATNLHLLRLVTAMAEAFAQVLESTPDDARGFHHSGIKSKTQFAANGCLETLVHTDDVAQALDLAFNPTDDLCARVFRDLFWGAPREAPAPWDALLWATGRKELAGHDLGPDWLRYWAEQGASL